MKVYIDTSALNRIFDDQSQVKIYMESSSMLIIFTLIDSGAIELIVSDVLLFENKNNPYLERHAFVNLCIQKAKQIQMIHEGILTRAQEMESQHIKGLDALHLACAEELNADYFLTCDDIILKRYRGKIKIQNPIDFVITLLKKEETNDR